MTEDESSNQHAIMKVPQRQAVAAPQDVRVVNEQDGVTRGGSPGGGLLFRMLSIPTDEPEEALLRWHAVRARVRIVMWHGLFNTLIESNAAEG